MPSLISILLLLIAGVCLQSAVSHLIAWHNHKDNRISAYFGLLCLLSAGYAFFTVAQLYTTQYASFMRLDGPIRYCSRLLIAFLPMFLAYYSDRKPGWPEKSLAILFVLHELVASFVPGGAFLKQVTDFTILEHPFGGPLPTINGIMGWNGYVLYIDYLLLLLFVFWTVFRLFKQKQIIKSICLFGVLLLTLVAYVHDLLSDFYSVPDANIGEYSAFLFLLVVGIDLGVRRVKSEQSYRTLFHSINDAAFVHDAHSGKILDVNETALRTYRADRETLLSSGVISLTEVSDRFNLETALDHIHRARSEGPQMFEWRCRRFDGTRFWAEIALRSAVLDGRDVVLATVRDVDDRVKSRERQAQSDELNKAIVEGFDGYIYICSQDHQLEYMNQRLIDRTGFDATGQTCHEVVHGLQGACPWCAKDRVQLGEKMHWETRSPKDNRWFDIFSTPLHRPDGSISTLALIRDITERKEAEQERSSLLARIHQGEKLESLGVLAGGAAHDFNNLLTAILGNADLVSDALPEHSTEKESIEKLKNAARKAAELTKQLLAYSGRGRFKVDPVSLNDTVKEVIDMLRVSLPPGHHLVFNLDPVDPCVNADATQLRQVVMNLLTNAAEATEDTQGSITFTTGLSKPSHEALLEPSGFVIPDGLMVFLEVRDEGKGMSQETRKRIFEPFYSTKFAGRGLGMAAVLGIVRSHHGAIQIESNLDHGTTIRVWMPSSGDKIRHSKTTHPVFTSSVKRALVVDDEPMVCDAVASALHSLGWEVSTANDGMSALEQVRANKTPPDLVFMDMTMPRLDGRQTAKLLKEIFPKIHILMMSGAYARPQDDPFGFSDMDGFLPKPFSIPELKSCINKIIPQEQKQ